ncbi:CcdB family protein [Sulfitobacter sp. OXR-159]|uniref:CcdB family protein n=1 Tax=Sulfitobacter sp. OXR-159 TaxID=3100174 RepID=UPI0039FDC3AA
MQKFDVFEIAGDLYLVVQADHLLELNTVVLVPVLPRDALPALTKFTVDVTIAGSPFRVRTHMPLTVQANRLRHLDPVHQLSAEEGHRVMDGLYAILWGL